MIPYEPLIIEYGFFEGIFRRIATGILLRPARTLLPNLY